MSVTYHRSVPGTVWDVPVNRTVRREREAPADPRSTSLVNRYTTPRTSQDRESREPTENARHQPCKHDHRKRPRIMDSNRPRFRAQLPYTLTRIIGACEICGVEYFRTKNVHRGSAGASPWDGEKLAVGRRWVVFRYFKTVTPQRIRVVAKSHDTKERNSGYSFKPITDC